MLLTELNIAGTTRRISNQELALDHPWYAELAEAPEIKYASSTLYGGRVAPSFGDFATTPDTFIATTWPPPRTLEAVVRHTETTEAAAVQLFTGTAHLKEYDRSLVAYKLRQPAYDVSLKANLSDTLVNLFATYCGPSYLDRALVTTNARASSPAISHNMSSKRQVADVLDDLAACTCHGWWDDGTTITLYDCLADNGAMAIDEFDFLPATYTDGADYSAFTSGEYSVDGSFPGGEVYQVSTMCHTNQTIIEGYLTDIKSIMERQGVRFELPICAKTATIVPGMRLSWTDESQGQAVTAWIRVQSLAWDFNRWLVTIEGRGGIA